jgi:hypothetical protein
MLNRRQPRGNFASQVTKKCLHCIQFGVFLVVIVGQFIQIIANFKECTNGLPIYLQAF